VSRRTAPFINRPAAFADTGCGRASAGRLMKGAVRRLTNWQMEPVYRQLDVLRAAIVEREGTGRDR
jgi:hypothetical protein